MIGLSENFVAHAGSATSRGLIACLAVLLLSTATTLPAQSWGRSGARSLVISKGGIVATSHTLASQAGAQVLARGGSAVDAALAANAVLAVTEPMNCGLGGDLFVLYWDAKTRRLSGLNASGWAPQALTPKFLAARDTKEMPKTGIHSVTVPGCVDGWARMHERFGRLPWKDLFRAAIHHAAEGFAIPEMIQLSWRSPSLSRFEDNRPPAHFLIEGRLPEIGDVFPNPDLARALRLIAEKGRDTFYRGEIAGAILATSRRLGGTMAPDDLAEFSSEWVEPISIDYRGWTVYELPPNVQGLTALQMLKIVETFSPSPHGHDAAEDLHLKIEAMKLAHADRRRYLADPRVVPVPTDELISQRYAVRRAGAIDRDKANCDAGFGELPSSDTIYLAVVDREGNIASWIQSISGAWGSGVVVDGMGFPLHNRGSGFVLDARHPNVLAGRKRPSHTIIPAFMEKGGLHIGFGIMGGPNQPTAHMQFAANVIDHGMDIQQALSAPRFTKYSATGCDVILESRFSPETLQGLSAKGHLLSIEKEYSLWMGRGQAVLHDSRSKMNYGATSPRADGSAEPEPLP